MRRDPFSRQHQYWQWQHIWITSSQFKCWWQCVVNGFLWYWFLCWNLKWRDWKMLLERKLNVHRVKTRRVLAISLRMVSLGRWKCWIMGKTVKVHALTFNLKYLKMEVQPLSLNKKFLIWATKIFLEIFSHLSSSLYVFIYFHTSVIFILKKDQFPLKRKNSDVAKLTSLGNIISLNISSSLKLILMVIPTAC